MDVLVQTELCAPILLHTNFFGIERVLRLDQLVFIPNSEPLFAFDIRPLPITLLPAVDEFADVLTAFGGHLEANAALQSVEPLALVVGAAIWVDYAAKAVRLVVFPPAHGEAAVESD